MHLLRTLTVTTEELRFLTLCKKKGYNSFNRETPSGVSFFVYITYEIIMPMPDKLEITNRFEKNEFWSTPIWSVTYDDIDNRQIEERVRELKFDGPGEGVNYGLLLESTYTPQLSYTSIIRKVYLSLYSINFDPPLLKVKDFKPKFYICKPNGCSSLEHSCLFDRGQEHDISLIYFVKVPKEKTPTVSFKDPRTLIVGNSFFKDKNRNLDYITFEPSEGTAIVFPPYLQYKIDVNLSDEDFIYFKTDMALVTMGDVVQED